MSRATAYFRTHPQFIPVDNETGELWIEDDDNPFIDALYVESVTSYFSGDVDFAIADWIVDSIPAFNNYIYIPFDKWLYNMPDVGTFEAFDDFNVRSPDSLAAQLGMEDQKLYFGFITYPLREGDYIWT